MADSLVVNEIFLSVQGESTWAGSPCVFVRLTGCDLRCSYCDTAYAFHEGKRRSVGQVLSQVRQLAAPFRLRLTKLPLVELTGGEPLLQAGALTLMSLLCDMGYTVLLETSGAHDIRSVDGRVHRIMDLKCPSSGEMSRNLWSNLDALRATDEVKFVIATREDYEWAGKVLEQHALARICPVLYSWASPSSAIHGAGQLKPGPGPGECLTRQQLAEQMIRDAVPARFQAQIHKLIWPVETRGV
ncbi:MAG TPA: radical SAM protein [Candidatus Paceibacterota bacterium]|nr:radical SAM protein [Verrucomicrobiota bacterium]HRY50609.1 radical SAM protein [Candidatus Paceibacterota bacterium]HRZ99533.1 radical SAM protein [Candidatus Paceibacterota bacterium]